MLKYKLSTLTLALSLSLTGGNKIGNNNIFNSLQEKINIEDGIRKQEKIIKDIKETGSYLTELNSLSNKYNISINYREVAGYKDLLIVGNENVKELDNNVYNKLNLIVKEKELEKLNFWEISNSIDFTKIDLSNIKEVGFLNFDGTFSYFNEFFKFERLSFSNTSLELVKEFLLNSDTSDTYIYWGENNKDSNLKEFLEFLVENNIKMKTLSISETDLTNHNGITKEEFDLISKLNVEKIILEYNGFKEPINLCLVLNENIKTFRLSAYKNNNISAELGTIEIESANKGLYIDFTYTNITKNTHFKLPDKSYISLTSLNCTDISAFNDLANTDYIYFKEYLGPGPEAYDDGAIIYYKDKLLYTLDGCAINYQNFEDMMKDLNTYAKLKELKNELNVSSKERDNYYFEPSIGDFINIINDDVFVYENIKDLKNDENQKLTTYGTSIIRGIKSIIMENGNYIEKVDNMDYYELLKEKFSF